MNDLCEHHAEPEPCEVCEEIAQATRAFDAIVDNVNTLRMLYDNANQRRSKALRALGSMTMHLAAVLDAREGKEPDA